MRYWTLVATTAALVFAGVSGARAETFYANPDGDDGDTVVCTSADAPCSFRNARLQAEQAPDRDTIVLQPGVYDLAPSETFNAPVAIEGVPGHRPTLRGAKIQLLGPPSAITDVNIVGSGDIVLQAVGTKAQRIDVTNAAISSTRTVCELDGAGSKLFNSTCHASPDAFGANAIELNEWFNLPVTASGDFDLRHVTAVSGGGALNVYSFAPTVATVTDSILAGSTAFNAATVSVASSATTGGTLPGAGNIQAQLETIFNNLTLGGVRPAAGSPTIDAGAAADGTDLDGNPRMLGTAPDMGALEWVPVAPVATTGDPIAITTGGAVVGATIDPGGAPTTFRVEYGPAGAGYTGAVDGGSAGAGTLGAGFHATIAGLAPGSAYHYRIVASNSVGTTGGADRTFTTTALPAATPTAKPKVTVSLASNKKCFKTRSTSLRVKIAKGGTITAVEVYVNKKRVKRVTKAADINRAIKVSKLPKGSYTLEVRVKTKDGRTVKSSKRYRTCSGH
jgi:hypothetical protein